jgi:hypothetical protein
VPKADEGDECSTNDFGREKRIEGLRFLFSCNLAATGNTPSSGFATFSPTKSVGEKALD